MKEGGECSEAPLNSRSQLKRLRRLMNRSKPFGNVRSLVPLISPASVVDPMKKTLAAVVVVAAVLIVSAATAAVYYYQPGLGQSGPGQLAIMATDPPTDTQGMNQAQFHNSGVQAHRAGPDASSGWVSISGSGTFVLTGGAGTTQTIASDKVQTGTYDMVRFDVDSVTVTYYGHHYSATVTSGTITASLKSEARVNVSSSSAVLVDLRTFIINTGNSSKPQFIFSATAFATTMPQSDVTSASLQVGTTTNLQGKAWFNDFVTSTSTNVNLMATMTSGSLDLSMVNTGEATAQAQAVIVTPVSAGTTANATLPSSLSGSAVFTVGSSGSLQASNSLQAAGAPHLRNEHFSQRTTLSCLLRDHLPKLRARRGPGLWRCIGAHLPHHCSRSQHLRQHCRGGWIGHHYPSFFDSNRAQPRTPGLHCQKASQDRSRRIRVREVKAAQGPHVQERGPPRRAGRPGLGYLDTGGVLPFSVLETVWNGRSKRFLILNASHRSPCEKTGLNEK